MNNKPLVSVCIPSYNHAQYLPRCIESILAQTYPNVEIVIVDDNSKDNSLQVAEEYAAKYPGSIRVHTHPNKENRGVSETVNFGFNLSKGKYWSGLPSDDALYKNKIEKQVEFLEANEECGFVYSYGDFMDSDGNRLPGRFGEDITRQPDPVRTLLDNNIVPGMTVLARRDAMEKVGLHDPELVYSDWDFWVRFFSLYKAGFIPESLVEYRIHGSNTSVGIDPMVNYEYCRQLFLKLGRLAEDVNSPLHEVKYRRIIENNIAHLPDRKAIAHLDNYFAEVGKGNFGAAFPHLREALNSSRRAFYDLRRSLAVVKYGILGISPMLSAHKNRDEHK